MTHQVLHMKKLYIKVINAGKSNLTFYMSNEINTKKSYNNELENKEKFKLTIPSNSDLVIRSLGFVNIKKETKITIYSDNDIFEIRNSIFNKE